MLLQGAVNARCCGPFGPETGFNRVVVCREKFRSSPAGLILHWRMLSLSLCLSVCISICLLPVSVPHKTGFSIDFTAIDWASGQPLDPWSGVPHDRIHGMLERAPSGMLGAPEDPSRAVPLRPGSGEGLWREGPFLAPGNCNSGFRFPFFRLLLLLLLAMLSRMMSMFYPRFVPLSLSPVAAVFCARFCEVIIVLRGS